MHRAALSQTAAVFAGFWPGLALAQTPETALAPGLPPDQALATAGVIVAMAGALLLAALAVIFWLRRRLHDARRHAGVLAQSQRRVAQALDGPKSGILLWAPGVKAVTLPPQIARLLGLPAGETLGLDRLTFAVSTPDRAMLGTGLDRLDQDGAGFDMACRLADGVRTVACRGDRLPADGEDGPMNRLTITEVSQVAAAATVIANEKDRLQAALDVMPMPVWLRRNDLSIEYCNKAYAQGVEAMRPQVVEKGIELMGGTGSRDMARKALEENKPQSDDKHVVLRGDRRLMTVTEMPLIGGGVVGYAADKTALDEAQGELKRHVRAHADVLESLSTAVAIFNADGKLRFYNSEYSKQFGLEEEFLTSEPTLNEVLEALRERRRIPEYADFPKYKRELMRELFALLHPMEELLHLPDGSTLRMVAAPHPLGGVTISYEDVTDTLRLERSYNTLIQVQRETLDHLYEGIAVFGSDGRLKLSNPAFARIWGLEPQLLENEPHVALIVDAIRRFFAQGPFWGRLRNRIIGRVADRDARSGRIERTDGSVLIFSSLPLADGGCLYTYLDVTDSTRVERALRERNAALEAADRLKSEFIANVSYELRTPLNAIIGFAEMLDQRYFGELNERQSEYSRNILEASNRLLTLINDILDVATIDAGYLQLECGPVNVQELLSGVGMLAGERARSRDINFSIQANGDLGTIVADERRLKQALYSVISNGLKFTPPSGSIVLGATRNDGHVEFRVTDTGIGIDPEYHAAVFEKFARVSSQGRSFGMGLGLALVKKLIELHGGRVELDSEPGQGTTITCFVPVDATRTAKAA
ncbi:MAG: ATP-binding protein [Dongiaceae bacterium]